MERVHIPREPNGDGLVLTHGAGGNCDMPLLVAIADAFANAGIKVLRYNLPFRQKRPTGPPPFNAAPADREGLRSAARELAVPGRIFLGGQSYGGRQASMLAAEDASVAQALLLLSYPLHAPGKPQSPRTAHFSGIRCPALFVHGGRDPFATLEELTAAIELIPGKTAISELPTAGHDLARGKFDILAKALQPFQALIS